MRKQRFLVLEDGTIFKGYRFGSEKETQGEIVFNTAMTGYQETLSDPSYTGQIITFTYPLIGNYGINRDDYETLNPSLKGMVVREACELPSNFRNMATLDETLKNYDVPGIDGIDTRKLTRIIRQHGVLKAAFVNEEKDIDQAIADLKTAEFRTDEVEQVSTKTAYVSTGNDLRVVLIDFGKKENIVRELNARGCDVTVMPWNTAAEEILRLRPDGVMLSNGPGNPEVVQDGIEMIRGILGKIPFFGICLGHQLFALACGATTFKMKFGHRGANHPVKNLATGKIEITSQNHGYSVDPETVKETDLVITHVALNDGTVEGLRHKELAAFSVQYHPEASPGPHDPNYLFDDFIQMMKENKGSVMNG
ncbi:glutamine-hydrolyzing carbamoyl-phosphate synthase small subunit [Macrococcus carouselicus]|uniref:Carbamoyl phosphate synthase small chain n=1 Tax=Macrococcus carouselicus TaxID=69969 RepID=A0A9Q8CN47_9STAP|nr:glutamine-hydrolyzing carbamoyl-phosphate synthase small subunit [Macrococcus carouselicus]TDM03954.1 carbamoyl-phosphate synthase small subunit [Macrococcus carouselicus]